MYTEYPEELLALIESLDMPDAEDWDNQADADDMEEQLEDYSI